MHYRVGVVHHFDAPRSRCPSSHPSPNPEAGIDGTATFASASSDADSGRCCTRKYVRSGHAESRRPETFERIRPHSGQADDRHDRSSKCVRRQPPSNNSVRVSLRNVTHALRSRAVRIGHKEFGELLEHDSGRPPPAHFVPRLRYNLTRLDELHRLRDADRPGTTATSTRGRPPRTVEPSGRRKSDASWRSFCWRSFLPTFANAASVAP